MLSGTDEHLRASSGAGKEDTVTVGRGNRGGDLEPREFTGQRRSKGSRWEQAGGRGQEGQEGPGKGRKSPAYSFATLGREQTLVDQPATGRLFVGATLFVPRSWPWLRCSPGTLHHSLGRCLLGVGCDFNGQLDTALKGIPGPLVHRLH